MNRLGRESSPYLLQHAHNPVDWYPWGAEAFAAARATGKPIFLSVGYSTCYWCHVMERQCFENEAIAAEMNRRFINIKVDREERPDVDQLYMLAVQALTRHGGWPMSVFLTPDLKPFYGGTYFPPTDGHGRPGFVTVLKAIEDAYRNRRGDVDRTTGHLLEILAEISRPRGAAEEITIDTSGIDRALLGGIGDYDRAHGGFGHAPKFPRQTLLELLLEYSGGTSNPRSAIRDPESESPKLKSQMLAMVLHALDAMAAGGIRDHLGGGFHRYSTDERWLVPHFEIMLYDNAMLAWCYAEAHRQSGERRFAGVARGILDFVLRQFTSPDGAFYTALDAETDAREGATYLWTAGEVEQNLGPDDARLFNRVYGLETGPNFADPHHGTGRPDCNVLYLPRSLAEVARGLDIGEQALEARLEPLRRKLLAARMERKQPLLDRKIITSWNALMIRAFAHAGQVLGERRYLDAAERAARFLLDRHRRPDGTLIHTTGGGLPGEAEPDAPNLESHSSPAFLDDYAFLAQAFLALHQATGEDAWRTHAEGLAAEMVSRFADISGGFFFTEAGAADIIIRQKIGVDSPLPSGNGAAALVLIELGRLEAAQVVIADFARTIIQQPESTSTLVQAAMLLVRAGGAVTVKGGGGAGAAEHPLSPSELAGRVVRAEARWLSDTRLQITLRIREGFHINATQAAPGLIPTSIQVTPSPKKIDFPPPRRRSFEFAEEEMDVYEGEIAIGITFDAKPKHQPTISLRYQACDQSSCLPPVTRTIDN